MFATTDEVEVDLGRELEGLELKRAETLLTDALALIRGRIPDVLNKCARDENFQHLVGMVQRKAVTRVLRNPDGARTEGEGSYTVGYDLRVASGVMSIMPTEWKDLGLDRGTGYLSFDAWRFQAPSGDCE